jgi:hypothetical protein
MVSVNLDDDTTTTISDGVSIPVGYTLPVTNEAGTQITSTSVYVDRTLRETTLYEISLSHYFMRILT